MATFPIAYSQASPSGRTGNVRANLDLDTGMQDIGKAVSNLGGAMGDIGQKIQLAEDASELSTLDRKIQENWNAEYTTLQTTQDPDARIKIHEKATQDRSLLLNTAKRNNVRQAAQQKLDNYEPQYAKYFSGLDRQMRIKFADDNLKINGEKAIESGNLSEYYKIQETRKATGLIGEAEYKKNIEDAPVNSKIIQSVMLANKGNTKTALSKLNDIKDNLTSEQLKNIDNAKTHIISIQNRNREQHRLQRGEEELSLYEKAYIKKEPLDWEKDIKNTILEPDEKMIFWNNYQNSQIQKQRTGISLLEEGDPVVNAQVTAIIDLRPESITESEIYKLTDKGLGLKLAPILVNRLKENLKNINTNPVISKYRTELSNLHTSGLFGKKDSVKTSDTYLKLQRKLDAFLTSNPTDEQASVFFSNLIREDVRTFGVLNENYLPGFDDRPLEVSVEIKSGEKKSVNIIYGDIIEIDGQFLQAVGRKDGKVEWQQVKPQ